MADKASDTLTDGASQKSSDVAAEYDLLPKLIPFLDRHLIFQLLEFLSGQEDEDGSALLKAKYELLKQTNMIDYVANLWQEINGEQNVPEEFHRRREEVLQRLQLYQEETAQIDELLNDESVVSNLRSDKVANLKFLEQNHGVTVQMIDMLYDYGRFQYDCGNYAAAGHLLDRFRILSTDNDKVSAATWGKLATDILTLNWEVVMEEINKIKESIETKLFNNPLAQLQQRTWLIHWSFFPLFNYDAAREPIIDLLFSPNFINTIQTNSPWVLRYLSAAVITNRNRTKNSGQYQKQLKDLVRIVRQEMYEYHDPVTDFIKALYVDFDFEEAQKKLGEAETILQGDFFLAASAEVFVESARHLISESYCKIHQRIDIKYSFFPLSSHRKTNRNRDLSTRLGLDQDEGEKWIVNLIRDTRVDAKIDYKDGTVVMNHPPQSVYQQVIERTKGGFFRTQVLRYVEHLLHLKAMTNIKQCCCC
jgi:translation initiation factor 3 subunit E